jgi:hypothetical protein
LNVIFLKGSNAMYCSHCNWDYPSDPDFELSGEGTCPGCGAKYSVKGTWSDDVNDDDGHHETGSDAGEGDRLLYEMVDEKEFDW